MTRERIPPVVRVAIFLGLSLACGSRGWATEVVPLRARPFPLTAVRLLEGPFAVAQQQNRDVLLQLDPDRLLHMFRVNAGLPSAATPYGGWEKPDVEVRGHTLGHYLTACALSYAALHDEQLKQRVDQIVAALAECQKALAQHGSHPGYLSAFPESFIDRVETGQRVWAPWYTLHKIMAGLLDAYQYCGNQQALDVLTRMAGWIQFRMDRLTLEQQQKMLDNEFGGMNEVLANLYAVTAHPDHLRMARVFDHDRVFAPLARAEDQLDGLHANTQVPKAIGAAREYQLTGEARYAQIAGYFWERVARYRSYVIGGHSDHEHFFPPVKFADHLSADTTETCNTYNMLKLTRELFTVRPSAAYMDFYERALYNHVFAARDPLRGMYVYYLPLKPGHFKSYSTLDDSFWCCFGTGMENPARYGEAIFAHADDELYVNLFVAAEVRWPERGLTLRQETQFPEEGRTRLRFDMTQPTQLALHIRHPQWATDGLSICVNDQPQSLTSQAGSYVTLRRTWEPGDVVEIQAPLRLHVEPLPHAPHWIALLYGPLVLCGDLGTVGLEQLDLYTPSPADLVAVPTPEVPVLVGDCARIVEHVQPVPGEPWTFRTVGIGRPEDVVLRPLFATHRCRYTVYWECYSEAGWQEESARRAAAAAQREALERRTVDRVEIGQPHSEQQHQLQGEHTVAAPFGGRTWRHADHGGWFSYNLKVLPDQPMTLLCTYWGSDAGGRDFDIVVDGTVVATQKLQGQHPEEFFDVSYELPASLTHGRSSVTVRFQAHPGQTAGGVFGCRMLRQP